MSRTLSAIALAALMITVGSLVAALMFEIYGVIIEAALNFWHEARMMEAPAW